MSISECFSFFLGLTEDEVQKALELSQTADPGRDVIPRWNILPILARVSTHVTKYSGGGGGGGVNFSTCMGLDQMNKEGGSWSTE